MSISVEVALLSGKSVALLAELHWTIGRLLLEAQHQLGAGLDQLFAENGELLNEARTLEESGLQSGNVLQASVRPKRLASSSTDFALLCETGSVVACSEVCLGKTLLPHDSLVDVLYIQDRHQASCLRFGVFHVCACIFICVFALLCGLAVVCSQLN